MTKRVSKNAVPEPSRKRMRTSSILGDQMDEFYDFTPMTCTQNEKKWRKIVKLMGSDESKLVLFSVPKGFDINKMNEIKGVDIPKEMKKPKKATMPIRENRKSLSERETGTSFTRKSTTSPNEGSTV